ncbi:MAG: hypothetical protein ABIP97_04945 [Chthoniobacterales bacterium]
MISESVFILFMALPMAALLVNAFLLKKPIHPIVLFLILSVVSYLVYLLALYCDDLESQRELHKLGIDIGREISAEEFTPQMAKALQNYTNDAGRTLAPISGLIMTPIYVLINFGMFYLCRWIVGLFRRTEKMPEIIK